MGLDLDDDGLSNLEEWQIFSNPRIKDTDGDGLQDNHEEGNKTNPTMQDTDGDGLDDKNETDSLLTAVRHSPILADSDHDGINDFEEYELGSDPMQPDGGIGAFSFVLYDDKTAYEGPVHLQLSTDSGFNGITFSAVNADLNGTIFPDYFYRSNLALNETYYVRAFIDLPVNARWDNGNMGLYDEGEPVAYGEVTLTDSDPRQFGINLLLKDAPPTIEINDTGIQLENKDHSAWVSNGWGVEANDSGLMMYSSRAPVTVWEVDDDLTAFGYEILLDGNFTQYLTANPPTACSRC